MAISSEKPRGQIYDKTEVWDSQPRAANTPSGEILGQIEDAAKAAYARGRAEAMANIERTLPEYVLRFDNPSSGQFIMGFKYDGTIVIGEGFTAEEASRKAAYLFADMLHEIMGAGMFTPPTSKTN